MKLTLIGSEASLDTDICLIKGLQEHGVDFKYYFRFSRLISPLFRINKPYPNGIICAKEISELQTYKDYIDLSNVFVISSYKLRFRNPKLILLYIKLFFKILFDNPDFIHFIWPQTRTPALLYFLPKKIVMTVHDPLPHSSHKNPVIEKYRRIGFKRADKLILLNNKTTEEFKQRYNINDSKIAFNRLGIFDYLDIVPFIAPQITSKYILFFGQIASYKGLEFLLPAMEEVHKKHPDWKLIVAGGGKMYFDVSKYERFDYLEIRNYFVDIPELVGLIKGCEFVVAPYKDATQSGILTNALSLSKPVIATDVGNFADIVDDGHTGLIIPPCDVNSLANAMLNMIENPDTIKRMSNNIDNVWKKKQNNEEVTKRLIEIYRSVIN